MKLRFACPTCEAPVLAEQPGPVTAVCGSCRNPVTLRTPLETAAPLQCCAVCGCRDLYRKKDFPQWLGMGVLTAACVLFYIFAIRYEYVIAWSILLGSAAFDAVMYWIVGDVIMCYRCGAQHRGIPARHVDPHEIAIAERYRQERIRRENLMAQ